MLKSFLFVGLPYVALVVCIAGSIYRFRSKQYSYSALSSQFLEDRKLVWGSVPWHLGLFIVFLVHLFPFIMPGAWSVFVGNPVRLYMVEAVGMAGGLLALVGLVVLLGRRLLNPHVQAVTTWMDLAVLTLFIAQILLGLITAATVRWGAQWATGTTTPYLWSILMLRPDMNYVVEMPVVVQAHLVLAYGIILLIPFSRLVHIFSLPLEYLFRAPQRVLWGNARHVHVGAGMSPDAVPAMNTRRLFLKGMTGMAAGGTLLSVGVMEKLFGFYRGPGLTLDEQAELLERNLKRLESTAEEKALELERLRTDYIYVANLSELLPNKGKYFIDYEMRPALAFLNPDGLPLLVSAKCTHLGCTVQADMNDHGEILCPCHVSWFNARTGVPNPGSPATVPLPILGWVVMDDDNNIVASKEPGKAPVSTMSAEQAKSCRVYIAKAHKEA